MSMTLLSVTAKSLTLELGKDVPEMYVVIAKHQAFGVDIESIAEVVGCDVADVHEVTEDPLYKEVRLFVGAIHSQSRLAQSTGWDHIEETALQKLADKIQFERDPEFLLKVAAVANRASRKAQPQGDVLDPNRAVGRVALTLTSRLTQKLKANGDRVQETEKRLSIHDGSMSRPSFDEVDEMLKITPQPVLPKHVEIRTHTAEVSLEDMDRMMQEKGF